MRALLAVSMLLLSGCALPAADPPEQTHAPTTTMTLYEAPPVDDAPLQPVELTTAPGTFYLAEERGSHGEYRLLMTPEGLFCEVEAGPDDGALGYLNVCALSISGEPVARALIETREGDVPMTPGVPTEPFLWTVETWMEVSHGNTTGWTPHDEIFSAQDARPEVYNNDVALYGRDVCGGEAIDINIQSGGHNGRGRFELDVGEHSVEDVSGGNWSVEDGLLIVTGDWDHHPELDATVTLRMAGQGCGGVLDQSTTYELEYAAGIEGVDAFERERDTLVVVVHSSWL